MHVHYLEIVTPEVEATCGAYQRLHERTSASRSRGWVARGRLLGLRVGF